MILRALRLPGDIGPSLAGFPFMLTAAIPAAVVGYAGALSGLVVAAFATFTVFLPVIAIVGGGTAKRPDLPMTPGRYGVLYLLWSCADFGGALLGVIPPH